MNVKARIGLTVSVMATIFALVFAIASIVGPAAADPADESAISKCLAVGAFQNGPASVTLTFQGKCPATQKETDEACRQATIKDYNLGKGYCITNGGATCRYLPEEAENFLQDKSCEDNPGYLTHNVKCTMVKHNVNGCIIIGSCLNFCATEYSKFCVPACGNNVACKNNCDAKLDFCKTGCQDP